MKLRLSSLSKMLLLSVGFSMALIVVRALFTSTIYYSFYVWNTFLAVIPYLFSNYLSKKKRIHLLTILLLAGWLLFFPNAPYMITDLFHFEERPPVPLWFDLIIVTSAAWNGLILGIVSLMQVEIFLSNHLSAIWVKVIVFTSFLLCGYGIFIGRFERRFNSWDVFSRPHELIYSSAHHILLPFHYAKLWVFTILFATLLCLIYFTLQKIPRLIVEQRKKSI